MAIGIAGALLGSGIASGVGSLLSSALQLGSQAWSQDFNKKEAEKARQFNSEEAQKARDFSHDEALLNRDFEAHQAEINRQWQTDMSNSAYQRSMTDMKEAGINPNLMAGGMQASTGSSSVPQGSQAQSNAASSSAASSSPLHFSNMFNGLSSALNAYATLQNQKLIAQMYNATSRANNMNSNNSRMAAINVSNANFQNSIWKYRRKSSSDPYGKQFRKNGGFEEL